LKSGRKNILAGGIIFTGGGAEFISSFITQKAAHRLYLFQAPLLLGAKSGKAWTDGVNIESMENKIQLIHPRLTSLGNDWMITGRFGK
jgi:diaminohydroxyphosphoribosylaminopyrimidine deaminase/5-amino-6-(5-phosphoribosylamino)uracil reductase